MSTDLELLRFLLVGGWPDGVTGGLLVNLGLAIATFTVGFLVAVPLAVTRLVDVRFLASPVLWLVELIRSIPLLLLVFWCHFTLPLITGQHVAPLLSAFVALSVYSAANQAEIIRAGLASVPAGEVEAALATGMTRAQAIANVLLPQGLRRMAPASFSFAVSLFKDTAVIYVVGIVDLVQTGLIAAERKPADMLRIYLAMAACFVVVSGSITYLGACCERKLLRVAHPANATR